jgi:NAD(P)H-dependent flavin oxidoreductase YrpB (nitropropane dioxygenase family)
MSGFEIFGVNPPLYLVRGAKDIGRKSGDSVSVEPFAVAIAAARAGHNGVVDLHGVDLGNAEERQELEAQLEILGRKPYASRLGIKGDIEQIADVEKLAKLLTLNGKKSDALSVEARQPGNFVVLVPSSGGRLQSLEQASFKKAVKKLCSSGLRVLVEVVSLAEAKLCEKASVEAVIAKGHEADGLVGDQTSFVLVQEITAKTSLDVISYGCIRLPLFMPLEPKVL